MQNQNINFLKKNAINNLLTLGPNHPKNKQATRIMNKKGETLEEFIDELNDTTNQHFLTNLKLCYPSFAYDTKSIRPDSKKYLSNKPFAPESTAAIGPDINWPSNTAYNQTNIPQINTNNFWFYTYTDVTLASRHAYFQQPNWIVGFGADANTIITGQIGMIFVNKPLLSSQYQVEIPLTSTSTPAFSILLGGNLFDGGITNLSAFYINLANPNIASGSFEDNIGIVESGVNKTAANYYEVSTGLYPTTSGRVISTPLAVAKDVNYLWLALPATASVTAYDSTNTLWIKLLKTSPNETWYYYFLIRKSNGANTFTGLFNYYNNTTFTAALGWPN